MSEVVSVTSLPPFTTSLAWLDSPHCDTRGSTPAKRRRVSIERLTQLQHTQHTHASPHLIVRDSTGNTLTSVFHLEKDDFTPPSPSQHNSLTHSTLDHTPPRTGTTRGLGRLSVQADVRLRTSLTNHSLTSLSEQVLKPDRQTTLVDVGVGTDMHRGPSPDNFSVCSDEDEEKDAPLTSLEDIIDKLQSKVLNQLNNALRQNNSTVDLDHLTVGSGSQGSEVCGVSEVLGLDGVREVMGIGGVSEVMGLGGATPTPMRLSERSVMRRCRTPDTMMRKKRGTSNRSSVPAYAQVVQKESQVSKTDDLLTSGDPNGEVDDDEGFDIDERGESASATLRFLIANILSAKKDAISAAEEASRVSEVEAQRAAEVTTGVAELAAAKQRMDPSCVAIEKIKDELKSHDPESAQSTDVLCSELAKNVLEIAVHSFSDLKEECVVKAVEIMLDRPAITKNKILNRVKTRLIHFKAISHHRDKYPVVPMTASVLKEYYEHFATDPKRTKQSTMLLERATVKKLYLTVGLEQYYIVALSQVQPPLDYGKPSQAPPMSKAAYLWLSTKLRECYPEETDLIPQEETGLRRRKRKKDKDIPTFFVRRSVLFAVVGFETAMRPNDVARLTPANVDTYCQITGEHHHLLPDRLKNFKDVPTAIAGGKIMRFRLSTHAFRALKAEAAATRRVKLVPEPAALPDRYFIFRGTAKKNVPPDNECTRLCMRHVFNMLLAAGIVERDDGPYTGYSARVGALYNCSDVYDGALDKVCQVGRWHPDSAHKFARCYTRSATDQRKLLGELSRDMGRCLLESSGSEADSDVELSSGSDGVARTARRGSSISFATTKQSRPKQPKGQ
eukprot:GHVN01051729.1.p1 GENE.GHVN01051729.1~~GHVN01051729.1.p1  ORF type:complete len:842 (+),score=169.48 GHVN01051729.1:978-3503(+)